MLLSPQLVVIRGRDISLGAPSLFWAEPPGPDLAASLAALGQLCPVIVDMEKKPVCLAGHSRVLALRKLGQPVRAMVLEPDFMARLAENPDTADISRETALGLVYLASNRERALSDSRLVRAGRYFAAHGALADLVRLGAPLLGLSARDKIFDWLRTWLGLPRDADQLAHGGHIPLALAKAVAALGPDGLAAFAPYLRRARWSRGGAEKFLSLAREAALAKDVPVAAVPGLAGLDAVAGRELSPNDMTAALTGALRAYRSPELTSLEERFAQAARAVTKGTKLKLTPSQGFEQDSTTVSVTVKNRAEVLAAAKELAARADSPAWGEIFGLAKAKE
jgi:hypothetical protein